MLLNKNRGGRFSSSRHYTGGACVKVCPIILIKMATVIYLRYFRRYLKLNFLAFSKYSWKTVASQFLYIVLNGFEHATIKHRKIRSETEDQCFSWKDVCGSVLFEG